MRENLWAWQLCEEQEHHLSGGRRIKSMGPISWYVQVRPTTSRRIRFGVFCLNRNSREFEFLTHISPDHILLFLKLKLKPAQRVDAWTENLKYLVEELSDAEVTHFSRWFAEEVSVSLSALRSSVVVCSRPPLRGGINPAALLLTPLSVRLTNSSIPKSTTGKPKSAGPRRPTCSRCLLSPSIGSARTRVR